MSLVGAVVLLVEVAGAQGEGGGEEEDEEGDAAVAGGECAGEELCGDSLFLGGPIISVDFIISKVTRK